MIYQLILTFTIWLTILCFSYYWTEKIVHHIPWLNFNVFICRKCFNFWSNTFSTLSIFLLSDYTWWIFLTLSVILNILTTIAIITEEKKLFK